MIAVPRAVLEEVGKAIDALPEEDRPFKKRATDRSFSETWWPFQVAMAHQNELVQRYGLRTKTASALDSPDWIEMPTCAPDQIEHKTDSNSKATEELRVIESFDGLYEYTSPVSRKAKWMAGYKCHLCYNGKFIGVVGHHIVAPGYEDEPWTHVVESDFESPDLPASIEQTIRLLFEKVPEFYKKLAKAIS
jgi:hypothetical protein